MGSRDKVSVIGAGSVGAACAFALLAKNITKDLVLLDKDPKMARDELMDMMNASLYLNDPHLTFSAELEKTRNSRVVVITAGHPVFGAKPDLSAVLCNIAIYREIIPEIVAKSPNCVIVVVTSPVDIMSYVTWRLSSLPPHRILGTGCVQLSALFRKLVAHRLGVAASSVHSLVIGELGPRSVPLWSGVSACGVRLRTINPKLGTPEDPERWDEVFQEALVNSYTVVKSKSNSTWGTAATVTKIVEAVCKDTRECLPVSTHITGCLHDIEQDKDVFLSLPCVLGSSGVVQIVRQNLSKEERILLQHSANLLHQFQKQLSVCNT